MGLIDLLLAFVAMAACPKKGMPARKSPRRIAPKGLRRFKNNPLKQYRSDNSNYMATARAWREQCLEERPYEEQLLEDGMISIGLRLERDFKPQVIKTFEGGGYCIVDFEIMYFKIIVEADGPYHKEPWKKARDDQQDAYWEKRGWPTLRFRNDAIRHNLPGCLALIRRTMALQSGL